MKFVLSSPGQAHSFEVAKELQCRGFLERLFTGYPRGRLAARGLAGPEVASSPFVFMLNTAVTRVVRNQNFRLWSEPFHKILIDRQVAKRLPACDVFVAISSVGLESGRQAKKNGAIWVCDRPCSHIRTQNDILRAENAKHGLVYPGISKGIIDREVAEYEECDAILTPSQFARRSFVEHGISDSKIWVIPYGVEAPPFVEAPPKERSDSFEVLFVGQKTIQKGVPYLLEAFRTLDVPRKRLTLVGGSYEQTNGMIADAARDLDVRTLEPAPRREVRGLMAAADVLVLPSLQDGFGMVVAEALASGCPVVVSDQAGAADIVVDGENGYVFPAGDSRSLASALARIAAHPDPANLRANALASVAGIGGWSEFVDRLVGKCQEMRDAR